MVQRKALSKPSFKAYPCHEAAKKPSSTNMKPSIQSLDSKARGPELAKKMKKSRSFKRSSDPESLKRPPLARPLQQPPCSPVKQHSSSPNYMRSTSSSEARKEQKQVPTKTPCKSVMESTSKTPSPYKLSPRSVNRSSALKKVRTLTKAPSFKPSRSVLSVKKCSKTGLCDVNRDTCSSTMKDTKFPSYLDLSPGGTESEGTSVMKVCPYNYCSLNGHRHSAAPPLKSFLSTRRRVMKAQRSLKPVASTPCKVKPCVDDNQGKEEVPLLLNEEKADFFVQVFVKEGEDQVPRPVVDFTEMDLGKSFEGEAGCDQKLGVDECVYDGVSFDWESSTSITLEELFDMEWEGEDGVYLTGLELEDGASTISDHGNDHTKGNEITWLLEEEGLNKNDVNMEFVKEFLEQEASQDEIIDCHEQLSDSESSVNDSYELDQYFLQGACDEENKTEEFPASNSVITEDFPVSGQADEDMENSGFTKNASTDAAEQDGSDLKTLLPVETISQAIQAPEEEEEEEEELTTSVVEEDESKADNKPRGDVVSNNFKKGSSGVELSGACSNSLIITKGKRSRGEETEELNSFNPREPNYLDVEPDPEAEKVDLKHQEIDERRNSEEWMLDFALRKAVDELAPARKRKVALLVAAFETVAPPARNCEARARRVSTDFARVQTCN